jgi:quercetin dioxygenase-like cupin family protein
MTRPDICNLEAIMPVRQLEISDVIDLRFSGTGTAEGPSRLLAKTATLEVRQLILSKGREIPTHHAPGEITVHCLEGRIAFTASTTRELGAGQMIVLAAGAPHSVIGLEDSTVLITKVLPANLPAS